jgi:hypothetical protein
MAAFVVERYLVGWSVGEMRELLSSVVERAPSFAAHGVRHLRSVVIAGDETCLCVFEGPDAAGVALANTGLPYDRIVAVELVEADA